MSEPSPTPRAPRRRGCALVLGGLAIFFSVYGWMFFSDLDELDDADLRLEYPVVLPEENAFVWLDRARQSRSKDLSLGEGMSIERRTKENREAFEQILQAASCELYVPPPLDDYTTVDSEPEENRAVLRLFAYEALEREDLDQLWSAIAAERKLSRMRSKWPYSTAGHHWMTVDRQMEFLTRRAIELQASPQELRRWLEEFKKPFLVSDWQQRTIRRQYELSVVVLTDPVRRREISTGGRFEGELFLRPMRTLSAYGDQVREWLNAIDEGRLAAPYEPPTIFEKLGWVFGGNFTGESLLDFTRRVSPIDFFDKDGAPESANDAIFKTAIALRIFALENGRYPTNLEELVPDLLPFVPIDPHDLQKGPLRWSADRRTLWSIGTDAVDDGAPADPDFAHGTAEGTGEPDRTLVLPGLE